jgi:hypothetical protein
MPDKKLFIVQQFEKQREKLVAGRGDECRTASAAIAKAALSAPLTAGVVALTTMVDTDTGEVVEEPKVLARYGEGGREFADEG